jgi:anti-anti-sigma factor
VPFLAESDFGNAVSDIGIKERQVGHVTILETDGQVRIPLRFGGSSVPLSKAVDSLLDKGVNRILLNLEAAGSVNARGLGEIVSTYVVVTKSGGQFKLFNLRPLVRELMMTTKLLSVFDVYESESQAVESFRDHDSASGSLAAAALRADT